MDKHPSLDDRIAGALRDIERTDTTRKRGKAGLESTLGRLEQRFNTRLLELERVRSRYYSLTDANREVENCIERLAHLVENASTEAAEASATLTLQLRTEMLSVHERFEDVTQDELEAEDSEQDPDQTLDIPRTTRHSRRQPHH